MGHLWVMWACAVFLKALEDVGLIRSLKVGREVYCLNVPLLAILKE